MLSMNLGLIELRHLRYFLAVAEAAHFTRAAAKLHVTQPTLSHQIRQLEGQLNLTLFDRIGRRIKLTAPGELLLPHARRVLRELEEAQVALGELHGLERGRGAHRRAAAQAFATVAEQALAERKQRVKQMANGESDVWGVGVRSVLRPA